jgi:hypothetical protein
MYFLPVEKDSSRRGSDVGVRMCDFLKGLSKLHVLGQDLRQDLEARQVRGEIYQLCSW